MDKVGADKTGAAGDQIFFHRFILPQFSGFIFLGKLFLCTTSPSMLRIATSPSRGGLGSPRKVPGFARGSPIRGAVERSETERLKHPEAHQPQHRRDADDLRHTELEFLEQHKAEDADGDARQTDAACLGDAGLAAEAHQHAQHHADADRLDDFHDVAHDLAGAELLEERRRQKRQRQGGAEDAEDREDAARHPGGLGTCKGGGVDAQRAGGHLGDGDEVRQIGVRHPAVGGHFIHDEGDHGGAAEAGEADLRKRGEELNEGLKHGHVRSPPSRPAR